MMVMDRRSSGLSNVELRRRKDLISTIDRPGGCDRPWGDCPIGIRVPVRYRGQAEISLARPARPGEIYRWRTSLAAPGGLLHCVPFINRPLSEVRPLLESRGVTVKTVFYGGRQAGKPVPGGGTSTTPSWSPRPRRSYWSGPPRRISPRPRRWAPRRTCAGTARRRPAPPTRKRGSRDRYLSGGFAGGRALPPEIGDLVTGSSPSEDPLHLTAPSEDPLHLTAPSKDPASV